MNTSVKADVMSDWFAYRSSFIEHSMSVLHGIQQQETRK